MGGERREEKGVKFRRTIERAGGRRARKLYVAIKFNIITLTSRPETKPGNRQGSRRYTPKDVDLRLFVLPVYLFCMMAQFTRGEPGKRPAGLIPHQTQQRDSRPDPKPIPRY